MRTFLIIAFYVGIVWLQIILSKKENKWLGLILPAICIVFSVVFVVLGSTSYTGEEFTSQKVVDTNGAVITEEITIGQSASMSSVGSTPFQMVATILILNIPTAVLLAIYFGCGETIRRRKHIDKMNIQDLE